MRTKGAKNKPKLQLRELPNTVVHVPTRAEYDELMDIYTKAGWRWFRGDKPEEFDGWRNEEKKTCIRVENSFATSNKAWYVSHNFKVISLSKFKKLQGLEPSKKKTTPEFKVGDRVKVIASTHSPTKKTKARIGTIGTVKGVYPNAVAVDFRDDWWGYAPLDLELIKDKPKRGRPKTGLGTPTLKTIELLTCPDSIPQAPSKMQIMKKVNQLVEAVNRQQEQINRLSKK